MIISEHPTLALLRDSDYKFHLIGSRYVGVFDNDRSDYDFLMECPDSKWYNEVKPWLEKNGFLSEKTDGYGPDRYLLGSCVWSKEVDGYPKVDLFPVSTDEANFRLKFFQAMKKAGNTEGGKLALALKREVAWEKLWRCLREFDKLL